MPDARTALPLCLLALLGAPAGAASPDGGPSGIEVRSGRVAAVDWGDRRLTLQGPAGRLDLGFDRNTVVYLPGHLGTMRDVSPGTEVRLAANPDGVAAWIEVQSRAADGGPPAPGGGGPANGASPGPDGGAPAAPDGGASAGDGGAPPARTGPPGRPDGGGPR